MNQTTVVYKQIYFRQTEPNFISAEISQFQILVNFTNDQKEFVPSR